MISLSVSAGSQELETRNYKLSPPRKAPTSAPFRRIGFFHAV